MALERVGLGAIVTADTKPMVNSMGKARDEMGRFVAGANKVPPPLGRIGLAVSRLATKIKGMGVGFKKGAARMGAGLRNLGLGLMPMGVGLGFAVKKAADFEKQMSAVGAITRSTAEDQAILEKKAKKMGIVSAFSATQAGEGMEYMARAGASTREIVAGLDGVMNAAAADGIDLATSADIVSRVVRGMGMSFDDASHIADTLALASSKSNTNITQLGNSFVYGAATAKQAGISLEETVSIFGKMADAGLKGSLAGTGFTNMLGKLTKPSAKARKMMRKWRIELDKDDGSLRNISEIVADFSKKIEAIPKKSERLAAAQEIFGKRGARAYGALASAGAESTKLLEDQLMRSSEGIGAAQEMAEKRLDNLTGKLTLFKSSLEGLAIGIFGPLMKGFAGGVADLTDGLNKVLFALEDIEDVWGDLAGDPKKADKIYKEHGRTVTNIALGIRDAVQTISDGWVWLTTKIKEGGKWLKSTFGEKGMRTLSKWIVLIGVAAGALAPLLLGGMMFKWVLGGIASMLAGMGTIILAAFWPMVFVAGAAFLAWQLLRRENEGFLETSRRVWGNIKTWALDVWQNVLKPMWEGFSEAWVTVSEELKVTWRETVTSLKQSMGAMFEFLGMGTDGMEMDWKDVGRTIAQVIGGIATAIMFMVKVVIPAITSIAIVIYKVFKAVWEVIKGFGEGLGKLIGKMVLAFQSIFSGDIISGIKRLGAALIDALLFPLQALGKGLRSIFKSLGIEYSSALDSFINFDATRSAVGAPEGTHKTAKHRGVGPPKVAAPTIKLDTIQIGRETGNLSEWEKDLMGMKPGQSVMGAFDQKEKAKVARTPKIDVGVNLEDKRELNIQNEMCIDGEGVSIASARHRQELQERAGFKATPWQRRAMLEHGAAPVNKAS